ncbi:HTH domain-containing protein [Anoxybacillus flavithermus]|uniref:HTH domain-containing protein n=1 Tax=Anoxybacillus flavithermus TaxID=33934 RepID=UPI0007DA102F|nr:HTH domain-containing protein [Anoxybacillus flavithermus]
MTREEKRKIRLQIISLLDRCEGCIHKTKLGASITECRRCPIGQKLVEASSNFKNIPKPIERMWIPWTTDEEQFVIKNYGKVSCEEMATKLGRTITSVQSKIKKLRKKGLIPR